MEFQTIRAEENVDGIGIITLHRPEKRNALSIRMRREISACMHDWEGSEKIRAVIFTGTAGTFSGGFDLNEFNQQESASDIFESSAKYHRDIWNFPKPVIAAINGPAMGGGMDLATLCDIRICSGSAVFGHPEIKFGAPPLFTPLRWIIGNGLARDLCLTGRRIDAQEAYRIGLVSEVVQGDTLMERALGIGATIIEAPLEALQFTKRFFTENSGKGFEESFVVEHDNAFKKFLLKRSGK